MITWDQTLPGDMLRAFLAFPAWWSWAHTHQSMSQRRLCSLVCTTERLQLGGPDTSCSLMRNFWIMP